jgi:methionyl-tRNA synthetase
MANKFYVTTPIYYVNDVPHIGHTCTTVAADIASRYHKLLGEQVFFLTGTDEHGAKVAEAAAAEGLPPQEFTDKVSQTFANIWPKLNIQYDYFIRTTNPDHEKIVQEILQKIYEKGDIYKGKYTGLYCVGCEKFITETELVSGRCPLHPSKEVVAQEEENYFFRLSKYVPSLIEAIEDENHPLHYRIRPEGKKAEVLARLKAGVNDLSISRAGVTWGIPLPWDKTQTIYVWVDALFNYYTATVITGKEDFWPPNLHLLAKDITWFHTVIWEALLIAADLALPKEIFIHDFYLIDGQKMSKSLGNVISPDELLAKYGVDGTRYLIAATFPALEDSNVSWAKFTEKYNADLANGLGNLVARIARLCQESAGKFPIEKNPAFSPKVAQKIEALLLSEAVGEIWQAIDAENKRINEERPWELADEKLTAFLIKSAQTIRQIAFDLQPFMPETAEKILSQFKGPRVESGAPLFPRL